MSSLLLIWRKFLSNTREWLNTSYSSFLVQLSLKFIKPVHCTASCWKFTSAVTWIYYPPLQFIYHLEEVCNCCCCFALYQLSLMCGLKEHTFIISQFSWVGNLGMVSMSPLPRFSQGCNQGVCPGWGLIWKLGSSFKITWLLNKFISLKPTNGASIPSHLFPLQHKS